MDKATLEKDLSWKHGAIMGRVSDLQHLVTMLGKMLAEGLSVERAKLGNFVIYSNATCLAYVKQLTEMQRELGKLVDQRLELEDVEP